MAKKVLAPAQAVARAIGTDRTYFSGLRPVLIGPRAGLHRYAVAAERTALGAYNKLAAATYAYPGKAAGSVVDLASVKIYAETANLVYFSKFVGLNGTCQRSTTFANRVRAANFVFKTANGVDRTAGSFYNRDVTVGDTVYVRGTGTDAAVKTLTTVVTGFVGEPVAAATGAATAEANNAATQSASVNVVQVTDTPINDIVATANGSAYLSTADGFVSRVYTVTVTQSSTGSNATTARLRVRASDGLDDLDNVVPSAFGAPTAVGTKGLTVTWTIDPANSSGSAVDQDDLVVGQAWRVTVAQAFTPPVATAAGTYTGTRTATYIVAVTRGGRYVDADKPQITVTSNNGYDRSGPTTVTAAATAFPVGNFGVTVSFAGTYLRKNDVYYVVATAAGEGAVRTLVLRDNVDALLIGQELDLVLSVARADLEIPSARTYPTDTVNWTKSTTGVTVNAGIQIVDAEFKTGSNPVPLVLDAAPLVVEYREWLTAGVGSVVEVTRRDAVAAALGAVDPQNPLAYAADKALANTAGELLADPTRPTEATTDRVMCVAIGGDPAALGLWTTALDLVGGDEEAYALVPLSSDPAVQALVAAHVSGESADASGFYRVAWVSRPMAETGAVVSAATTADALAATATIAATSGTSPTAYTTLTASANAAFVTKGVRAGDVVRIDFGTDVFGASTYTSYVVDAVLSQTTMRLATGPVAAVAVARMIEVWRAYTKPELVAAVTAAAAGFASERVRYVYPDRPAVGGTAVDGHFLCAALAGLTGSVPSHQGLRNVGVEGFDDLTRASRFFTAGQLDDLAADGVFVVSQTPAGVPYVRSAVTTDPGALETREEMIVRNADMVRKAIQDAVSPYVGPGNVGSHVRQSVEGALASLTGRFSAGALPILGAPVGRLSVTSLEPGSASDVLVLTVAAEGLAVPLNQLVVVLPVTA